MKRVIRTHWVVIGLLAALVSAACTMKKQEAPSLTGPSEFGTSISVSITPDVLTQDGASQAIVTITARDASSAPIRNLLLRAEIAVGGVLTDFGTLSARTVATGSDGRATLSYTAPPASAAGTTSEVEILVTPSGNDFGNAVARSATLRLVPQGVILPPAGLQPAFTFTPSAPVDGQSVVFDASTSAAPANNPIAEYRWNFGDGRTSSGVTVTHAFNSSGTFPVTLTILDAFGRSASRLQTIQVTATSDPTASFVFSPDAPLPGQVVNFNAAASRAATGRTIARYDWDFGDGSSGSGSQVAHAFGAVGTYRVTLVVTDDAGRVGSTTSSVAVGTGGGPTATFTFSPTSPLVAQVISFNASPSTAPAGRTIVSYGWNFGDGFTASGVQTSHSYAAAGTYNVTLTVTDSTGAVGTTTSAVAVGSNSPTADFTFSPTTPPAGTSVFFNASASRPAAGRTIVLYSWNFGDGSPNGTGVTFSKVGGYAAPGTYVVTLTVTDDQGNNAVISKTIAVSTP